MIQASRLCCEEIFIRNLQQYLISKKGEPRGLHSLCLPDLRINFTRSMESSTVEEIEDGERVKLISYRSPPA